MNILVFSNFFPPEIGAAPMRISEHAQYWAAEGHDVTVVTNVPNSPLGKIYEGYNNRIYQEEIYQGIRVRRVFTVPAGKRMSKWRRGASFVMSTLMYCLAGLKRPVPDIVVASAPYFTGICGLMAACWHNKPYIYEMRDPWLQVAAQTGNIQSKSSVYAILSKVESFIARNAKEVVVVSQEMALLVQKELQLDRPPSVIRNAINFDMQSTRCGTVDIPDARGRFVIGMIGNMGHQYDFDVVVDAAADLADEPCFFMFLGDGAQKKRTESKFREMKLGNAQFFQPVPPSEVASWMRSCDVTVVSMRPEPIFRLYLPKKVLDSLFLGVPVLFGGNGEVQEILEISGGGAVFPPGDRSSLAGLIRERLANKRQCRAEGDRGRKYVQKFFNRRVMALKYLSLMTSDQMCL